MIQVTIVAALAAAVLLGVLLAQSRPTVQVTAPSDGATVGLAESVAGRGWVPDLNNYLVVEPLDGSGRRWVQAQIASPEWTRTARFGEPATPSGMQFRIYVLSTPTELPIGELRTQPERPRESGAVTVTLQK